MASPAPLSLSKPTPIAKQNDPVAPSNMQTNQPSTPNAKKNPKEMTKAERRELQERQRAAKVANAPAKGQGKGAGKDGTAPHSGKKAGGVDGPKHSGPSHTPVKHPKESAHASAQAQQQAQLQQQQARGLRIFAHFGLTKPPSNVKSDAQIHPAVVGLGLQFSSFKIVGANARCIATLTALKNVSV